MVLLPCSMEIQLLMAAEGICQFHRVSVVTYEKKQKILVCSLKRKKCFILVFTITFKHLSTCTV